jgi:flagellar P-ring protein precursor FlgI
MRHWLCAMLGFLALTGAMLALTAEAMGQPGQPGQPGQQGGGGAGGETTVSLTDVVSVQEIARIQGQGESVLRGIGMVMGLKGTGDSGADPVIARPLAQFYESNGNPMPELRDLAKAKSVAMVAITAVIPAQGARADDTLDVFVTTTHTSTSLAGGRLFLSPMAGPLPGQGVYAIAEGPIVVENPATPTVGRVRMGARVIADVLAPVGRESFTLILEPTYRHFAVADQLADTINALAPETESDEESQAYAPLAQAVDDVSVRVTIPAAERGNSAKFIGKVMTATMSPSLLRLPAQVIVNTRTGSIVVTGNVEVSSVAIAHKDLVITSTEPVIPPTPQNPVTRTTRWTSVGTTSRVSDRARIQDLLAAFKQMDVPIEDQINILTQIHRSGRLHARLVID